MIIGVALVVDEFHKGQRLVLRYPEANPSFALFSGETMMRFHEEYLSLSPDKFARLFRPKPAFFNRVLEITIGDINYISYPTPCLNDSSTHEIGSATSTSTSADASEASDSENNDGDDVITLFTVVVARVRDGLDPSVGRGVVAPGVDPVSSLLGLSGQFLPVAASVLRNGHCSLVATFARALLREQQRCGYVSKEVKLILGIQEAKNRGRRSGAAGDIDLEEVTPSVHIKTPAAVRVLPPLAVSDLTPGPAVASPAQRALSTSAVIGEMSTDAAVPNNTTSTIGAAQADVAGIHVPEIVLVDGPPEVVSPLAFMAAPTPTPRGTHGGSGGRAALGSSGNTVSSAPAKVNVPSAADMHVGDVLGSLNMYAPFSELIMLHSTLANEFRNLYHSIIGGTHVNLTVNKCLWITMPLQEHRDNIGIGTSDASLIKQPMDPLGSAVDSNGSVPSPAAPTYSSHSGVNVHERRPFQTFLTIGDDACLRTVVEALQVRAKEATAASVPSTAVWDGSNGISDQSPLGRVLDEETSIEYFLGASMSETDFGSYSVNVSDMGPKLNSVSHKEQPSADRLPGLISGQMWEFLRACDPTKSYAELAEVLECSLDRVFAIAGDLERLGLGRSVTCLSACSVFSVHPEADVDVTARAARTFRGVFGQMLQCELYMVLSLFDGSASLGGILKSKAQGLLAEYMLDVVAWLLRWNLIIEVNVYLCDIAAAASSDSTSSPIIKLTATDQINHPPSFDCEELERDAVMRMRLQRYLHGNISLTEILWHEPDITADTVLDFAERNDIAVVHYCCEASMPVGYAATGSITSSSNTNSARYSTISSNNLT